MDLQLLLQIIILGCIKGAIYSLIGVGFALVFGVAKVINIAHGTYYMLGGYFIYFLLEYLHFPYVIAIIAAIVLVGFLGVIIDIGLIRPMRQSLTYITIITLALGFLIQYFLFAMLGAKPRNVPFFVMGDIQIGGFPISNQRIFIFIIFILIVASLFIFLKFTRFGKAVVAVSQNYSASTLMGIPTEKVFALTSGISALMAALAGVMISPLISLTPLMWFAAIIKAFSVVVLGGLGSIAGSIVASFILGFSEIATTMLISSYLENTVALLVIAIMLLVRPSGLFGARLW